MLTSRQRSEFVAIAATQITEFLKAQKPSRDDVELQVRQVERLSTRYLHGTGFHQILASETVSGNVVTWALADQQGTVRDMVRYVSGSTTAVNWWHRRPTNH